MELTLRNTMTMTCRLITGIPSPTLLSRRRYTYSDSQDQYNSFVEQPSAASLSSFDSLHFVPPSGIPPDNDMPSFLSAPYRSQSPAPSTISDSTIIYSAPSSEFSTPSPLPYSSPYSSPSPHAPRQRSLKHEITDKADALKAQATSKYQEKDFEAARQAVHLRPGLRALRLRLLQWV